jgi:hypothetical protein
MNKSAWSFSNTPKGTKKVSQYKPVRKTVEVSEEKSWDLYLKRTAPEKVYSLAEQIAFVERKISAFELQQPKLSPYTRYKQQYLASLKAKKEMADFNAKNTAGFKTTFGSYVASK